LKAKNGKIKIKWRIFSSMAFFTAIIICLLWLFQVVFLDDIYRLIKNHGIKKSTETVAESFNENIDMTDFISKIATKEDVCIMVITENGGALYNCHSVRDCVIHKLANNKDNLVKIFKMTQNNGGSYFESFKIDTSFSVNYGTPYNPFSDPQQEITNEENLQSNMVSSRVIYTNDGTPLCIISNSTVAPLTSTVETLNIQLLFITLIMLILASVLALIISRSISKPISKMNEAAKELSKGNYNVIFSSDGDYEISQLGETLNYTASELSKVEQYRKDLLANISHDMRTPLTMITGYGEVMRDIPGENNSENIQIIIDEANRLSTLVNDALDMSKLQSGESTMELSVYSLTESVNTVVERYRKMVAHNGYSISFDYYDDIKIKADEIKISQVIYNLLTNSINYTGDNKKVIVRQLINNDDNIVRIEFEDFGEGIAKDQFHNIWDRYYKIDKTHKRGTVGTGLGLTIVRNILELHNARYGLRSTVGKGSVFWFEFPIER